jgi:CRP/FNR family cyclic AMP-dependent transcriptional regulator
MPEPDAPAHPPTLAPQRDEAPSALPDELLHEFERHGADLEVARGAVVVREGDPADSLFLVREGRLRVYGADESGREVELDVLGPGRYFGELMLGSAVRTASVKALTPARLGVITRESFVRVLAMKPDVAFHVIQTLIARVRALTDDVRGLALMDVYGRVVALLERGSVDAAGERVVPFLSQQSIAERIGASRSMVNRIMNDLIAGGYVEVTRERIVLRRPLPRRW